MIKGHIFSQGFDFHSSARAIVDEGNVEYFQFKFIADRDSKGKIIGLVVGIHNIDDEMREELELRQKVEELVDRKTEELKDKNIALSRVNERIIAMVGDLVEKRDEESGEHIHRVKYLTRTLAMQVMKDLPEYNLTVEDVFAIANVSPLHDIGKIRITDRILLKPGKLTAEEFEVMKTHCEAGCEILEGMIGSWDDKLVKLSIDICRYHHEKWDGGGYPHGLKGDDIPIAAQIVSIADAYDALVSKRCYKDAFPHDVAYEMIAGGQCGMYSEKLLSCLEKCRGDFAISSDFMHSLEGKVRDEGIRALATGEYISEAMPLVEQIAESMPGGFFIYQADEDEKLIYFNDTMVDYFGCSSREEFVDYVGNSFKGIVHSEDYKDVTGDIGKQINDKNNSIDHVVYRIIRKDGSIRWLDDYGRYVNSDDMGEVFFVFVNDFTETYLRRNARLIEPIRRELEMEGKTKGALRNLKVLVVDDSDDARELHIELLEDEGATVVEASDGLQAVNLIKENMDFDFILMDLVMPVMSGVSAIREIKRILDEAGKHISIICLTAEGSDMQIKEALEAGAYECLYKPLNISELSAHVIASIRETTLMMEKQLAATSKIAFTDSLTNVKSIAAYTDKISELAAMKAENENIEFAVVMCDCDDLKIINDTYGHDVGDRYICNTSAAICDVFKHSPVYRIGGDEFVAILQGKDYRDAEYLMEEMRNRSNTHISLHSIEAGFASYSVGFAVYDRNTDDTVGSVIKRADEAMYGNKE